MEWTPFVGMCIDDLAVKTQFVEIVRTKTACNLLVGMCAAHPTDRVGLTEVIHQIENLVKEEEVSELAMPPSKQLMTPEDLAEYKCPLSGCTLKAMLDKLDGLCNDIDKFKDVNQLVVDRLNDIYMQLENVQDSLQCSVIEDFGGIVHRFSGRLNDRLDQYDFGGNSVMAESAALTIADRNHSLHHQLDKLLWNSDVLDSSATVHQWRQSFRKASKVSLSYHDVSIYAIPGDDTYTSCIEENDKPNSTDYIRWLLPADEVQINKRISSGSYGAAYLGKWLGTDVVVKKVLTNQEETRNRLQFQRETELWFSLNHANLIKLYGAYAESDKQPVFVCELTVHGTLSAFLAGKSREEKWGALYSAAYGLQYLHDRGIIHGDLKGNNVLVCDNNLVKLADFGLSVIASQVESSGAEKGVIGAIRWKAPECICGAQSTFASDIYSFGMCIVEVITDKFPWGTLNDPAVESNVVTRKRLPPRSDEFTDEEWELVRRMCSYQPGARIDVGAVVCLLYQLYSGPDSFTRGGSKTRIDLGKLIVLQRYQAYRHRSDTLTISISRWFIPLCEFGLEGGFALRYILDVYNAHWLDEHVVVKQLMVNLGMDTVDEKTHVEKFRREARVWSELNHPNIEKLYGVGYSANMEPRFVCEEAANRPLYKYLKKNRDEIWRTLYEAARGIQYLHERGIVHNGLRCRRILVCESGIVKVAGFSSSTFAESAKSGDGYVSHGVRWKAPEILWGQKPTLASDIYSFGMCIIEAVSGRLPWGGISDIFVKYQVERGQLPSRSEAFGDREWELVVRMCHFDPESRIGIDSVLCCIANFSSFQRL